MHMKSLKNNFTNISIGILLITIGILIGKYISFPYFEISKTIDLVNIASIVVTIILAIIITTFFDKRKSDFRIEKDLIIKRVDNIYEICSKLQLEAISGEIPYIEAASSIKRINTSINSVYKLISKCKFNTDESTKNEFKSCIGDLRNILTDTPLISEKEINSADIPISVKDGVIHFNRNRISQIELKFDTLKDLLLEWQIVINKK